MNVTVREVSGAELEEAALVEKYVFEINGYPYEYRAYDSQSTVLAAYIDDKCVGVIRLISQSPVDPPIVKDCKVWNPQQLCELGDRFEEVGTVAVLPEYEHSGVGMSLYLSAYGSALDRGVTHWGIVMEPERVEFFNTAFHFAFQVIGEIGYKGWDCAPYLMEIERAERNMFEKDYSLYQLVQQHIPARFRYRF